MENIIYLHGQSYEDDMALIEATISRDPVFLFDEPQTELHQYIDYLHEECGLKIRILNKLRICREISFAGNVTLVSGEGTGLGRPGSMGALLEQLQPGTRFRLVIENNSRPLLANIVQQLIYINYPITEVDMKLRSEYKDAAKTALFMEHIQTLQAAAKSAVDKLSELSIDPEAAEETREKLYKNRALALSSYKKICEQIDKAQDVEMKVAVAASKKTGKSVMVNCMLGVELAPTSLELATPNTCIYKRSPDGRFHLQMAEEDGGLSPAEDFDTAEQLHKRLSLAFKKAQADVEAKFAAPDMRISYVSNGNNFESYTVYDTPGPDLAGAEHNAEKSVNECDVAIFAIDYTKYLTKTEEAFLRQVKALFQEKHKFHTLVFVINKMDEALSDKGTKSRVKSIDFIRSRLRDIDPQYGDCIVFATSAQDYFYTLELEDAAGRLEELAPLRDPAADLYQHLRPIMSALRAGSHDDEDLIRLLTNLDGEAGRIQGQLGYPKVDVGTLRHYSGIPQLMDYVSYIARSKAREEIVNSITYTIAAQCGALRAIISQIANMEELMGRTQQEIAQISAILDGYVREVRGILSGDLTEEDLRCLDPQNPLAAQVDSVQQLSGGALPVKLPEVLRGMREGIAHLRESQMQRELWNNFYPVYQKKIKKLLGQTVSKETLDVSADEVQKVIESYLVRETGRRIDDEIAHIEGLVADLKNVVVGRMDRITACTGRCQQLLAKNDCHLQLPEPAAFEAAIPAPELSGRITVNKKLGMSGRFHGVCKDVKGLKKLCRNLFVHGDINYNKEEVKVKHPLSDEEALRLQGPFYDMLADAQVYQGICQVLNELSQGVVRAEDKVLGCFYEMNDSCAATIEAFKRGIDDRDYYEDKLADYARMKALIASIQDASKDFLDTWALVLAEENR